MLTVIPYEENGLVIVVENNAVLSTTNLEKDLAVNLFGTIESCYYQDGFYIQVKDSAISSSQRLILDPSLQQPYYLVPSSP